MFAQKPQSSVQIGGCGLCIHAAIDERNEVREMMVAEKAGDALPTDRELPRPIESFRIRRQSTCLPKKTEIQRSPKNAFVGPEPLESFFGGGRERLVRYGTFRGPQAHGWRAEYALVIVPGSTELFPRILRTAISPPRQRRRRIRDSRDV